MYEYYSCLLLFGEASVGEAGTTCQLEREPSSINYLVRQTAHPTTPPVSSDVSQVSTYTTKFLPLQLLPFSFDGTQIRRAAII